MPDTSDKLQRIFEEITVTAIPILIILIVLGTVWTLVDEATAKNIIAEILGSGGVFQFFKNIPSDGLKVLLIGVIITMIFGFITIGAITANEGRRFWYKLLFRKDPP